jgi:Mg-chelatase subunit ChlD
MTKVDLVVVLDRSGSMATNGKIGEAISSFNRLIEDLRDSKTRVTLALFDDHYTPVYDREKIASVVDLTDEICYPRGMTALYDAIGKTVASVEEALAGKKPRKVVFAIITDGQENSSHEFDKQTIKGMITSKQVEGWDVRYFGAGIDAYTDGTSIGVLDVGTHSVSGDSGGIYRTFSAISHAVSQASSGGN